MNEMTLPRTATTAVGPPPVRSTASPSAATTSDGSLGRRLWRGPTSDPAWARPALLGLLLATAAFYLWNLTANGWANSFYSAAVQAGSDSWKAFFFGSSDAANSITVDKPPAALWIMALSVRVFGLSSFSILLPEVLMGVASVGVLYTTVKRQFGAAAGLIAGGILALTPVAVLMFRFNNPEALLTLLMTLAAWATMRSIEKSSPKWFMLVGVFIGLGFLTKTLQAFLVVPGFALAYLVAAKPPLLKRIWHTVLGGLAIVVSAGWWVAIVELIPASMRPYIGGSQTNSFLELTFGYNGLGRISGDETGSVGGAGGGAGGNWGATGLGRLFNAENGGQISWLMPAALLLLVVGLVMRARAPRTDARRAAYLVWGSWFVVTLLVFSLMAGIYHAYYTIALAPAVAALVAMGAREAWERRDSAFGAISLAVAMAATSVWSFLLLSRVTTWNPWLRVVVLALGMAAAFGFLVVSRLHRRALPALVGLGLFAALLGPAAYSVQTVSVGLQRLHRHRRAVDGRSGRPRRWRYAGRRRTRWHGTRRHGTRWHGTRWHGDGPWWHRAGRHDARRHRHGPRRRWRTAQRKHAQHRGHRGADRRCRQVHLGRGGDRLAERGRAAAGHPAAGHGHRRVQRLGPLADVDAVPAVRRRGQDPLLRQRRRRWRRSERRQPLGPADLQLGRAELHQRDDWRVDLLRPDPAGVRLRHHGSLR